ncbi:hypothetical protein [Leptospira mayottensis]|uniref:hypothetical protein n=1 Tax=Leptospira mayottensis TaxID=1137606 RepID=UPI0002BE01AF|nr:hypothetical protein [Leptospira mayottensis]AXR60927.1 hypothetical protein DQM68_09760 [Leptospira mayottensis]AZQ02642.1 hypothetical protein LEP1GSC190_11935 [Leptospira mayottensis 200901116]TGN12030.1 hypothetical protein EHR03_06065 [Leptospira mayottensis]
MKIQYFGIIFVFFNCSFGVLERQTGVTKNLFTGDTLVFGGISISLLFLFGLVLKGSVQKSPSSNRRISSEDRGMNTNSTIQVATETAQTQMLETRLEETKIENPTFQSSAEFLRKANAERILSSSIPKSNQTRAVWKREIPTHPELILSHRKFLERLGSRLGMVEIYFLSGDVSLLLASRKGKVLHIPESPEENMLTEKSLKEIWEGRIEFTDTSVFIPLSTGVRPFGYLKILSNEWNCLDYREFQTWKEEYEEQISIQFESSDPETGFGNLHAFELDKMRVDESILIFASILTDSPSPYILKWISLWTSKILRRQIRFYRIRKDRIAFFVLPEEWEHFSKNLKELVESLQKDGHSVDLNLGVSILEENREEWSMNARKALGLSIEEGPNRYICL